MAKRKVRIVLDTNWYISATINQRSRLQIYELLDNINFVILFSNEILSEFNEVIRLDKFKKIISQEQITRFMNLVISKIEYIEIKSELTGSRDINDNFLLSLSFDGKADYLITGDTDLLVLKETGSTKILTLNDF
jgi:putative PIN family toxin of toxin-antitoxin system